MKTNLSSNPVQVDCIARNGANHISLNSKELESIIALTLRSFGKGMNAQEVEEHVLPVDFIYLARHNNHIAGFASLDIHENHTYLAGTVVDPEFQGMGIYSILAKTRILETLNKGIFTFKTRTQNPIIEYSLTRELNKLHKNKNIKGFSIHRTIVNGIYGRMLTSKQPFSKDSSTNEFYAQLNYEQGDAFSLIYEVSQ